MFPFISYFLTFPPTRPLSPVHVTLNSPHRLLPLSPSATPPAVRDQPSDVEPCISHTWAIGDRDRSSRRCSRISDLREPLFLFLLVFSSDGAPFKYSSNKHSKPDSQTAEELSRMMSHYIHGYLPVNEAFVKGIKVGFKPTLPKFGVPIDGLTPPKFPPIRVLDGKIEKCSRSFEKQLTITDLKGTQGGLTILKSLVGESYHTLCRARRIQEVNKHLWN